MARRRVYIRGVGAYTPLAGTWPETMSALAEGKTAIAPVRSFDVTGFPCTVAAAILGEAHHEDRRLAFARRAAAEAWQMADVLGDPGRIGVFVGAESGRGTFQTVLGLARAAGGGMTFDHDRFARKARPFAERIDASVLSPSAVASVLAGEVNAGGPVETISLACASGSAAILEGARAIRLGLCDIALCGGVGADVDPLMMVGFGLLGILSARGVSCPFDLRRDGFVVGEGAAMVVLSSDRGDAVCELAGSARTLDAHNLTAPDPRGEGAARAMEAALGDAGLRSVDYVQAHGTSTQLNDAIEAAAIRRALGPRVERAHVSSVKGALGHWVAGAGVIGFLCAWEAVRSGTVLPTAGLEQPDPACEVPHVMGRAVHRDVEAALANSFAFGGANSCLVISRTGDAS
jgi:3-oxoacyl-[acyl-carrier-protein] synthase II